MLTNLESIKQKVVEAKKVTRQDIYDALLVIKESGQDGKTPESKAVITSEITEMVTGTYDSNQIAKLLADLNSYGVFNI